MIVSGWPLVTPANAALFGLMKSWLPLSVRPPGTLALEAPPFTLNTRSLTASELSEASWSTAPASRFCQTDCEEPLTTVCWSDCEVDRPCGGSTS